MIIGNIHDKAKWKYLIRGIFARILGAQRCCPNCGHISVNAKVDSKLCFDLLRCNSCEILFRYPVDSIEDLVDYYQNDYQQSGLTTNFPGDVVLETYLENNFRETEKDFSDVIDYFGFLGFEKGSRILDFGANWGYASFQMKNAGFEVESYEISRPRADFGKKIGVEIKTDYTSISEGFDIIFSSHVLEHLINPTEVLDSLFKKLNPGGIIMSFTPNGSDDCLKNNFPQFHCLWGMVHPVLLTDRFFMKFASCNPYLITTNTQNFGMTCRMWDGNLKLVGPGLLSGTALMAVIRKL